ncbi:hypothetical protein N7492_010493 [Penicillium capsulatum]|uniref:GRF-like zinc ribbon domain-containing protein n=1 Tax=Penicillium capsulatum TaxID=69766 RepID=A0A9W9LF61_9EURO|nr:hypothetical protein N7492_010493 [Penicillium capsulatum]KAJ6112995.1 hypothetical protein N7512_008319 [Penicillium capsulatum]
MTIQIDQSAHGWKCQQCGLPGVRLSTNPNEAPSRAYYKCVPCDRFLGLCPCTTPGDRTTSTCPCGEHSDAESPGLEENAPRGLPMPSKRTLSSVHNPNSGFDEDWEANCSPGFMVSRFKARGLELPPFA